ERRRAPVRPLRDRPGARALRRPADRSGAVPGGRRAAGPRAGPALRRGGRVRGRRPRQAARGGSRRHPRARAGRGRGGRRGRSGCPAVRPGL
ncbi:MAG: hypothetical protein AVDCRST_MAG16-2334, partial [uncultured Frankineae bacterium]